MRIIVLMLIAATASACASVTVDRPVKGATVVEQPDSGKDVGLTYYEPMFVMVVSCSDGKASAEIKTLPNYAEPRVVRWSNGLFTSAHPSVKLVDGWRLEGFDSEVTSTMGDVAGAVGTVAAAAVAVAGLDAGGTILAPLPAGIYRMAWTNGEWRLDTEKPMISLGPCAKDGGRTPGQSPKPGTEGASTDSHR